MTDGSYDVGSELTVTVRGGRIEKWDPSRLTHEDVREIVWNRRVRLQARIDELTDMIAGLDDFKVR